MTESIPALPLPANNAVRSNAERYRPSPTPQSIGPENPTVGKAAKKTTTARAFQASKELSEEELLQAVAESSKTAAVGVAKVREGGVARARCCCYCCS